MIVKKLVRCKRVLRTSPYKPFITELEKREHNKLMKEYRRINTEIYERLQTKIENDYIDWFNEKERKKKLNDELKLRTQIVMQSYEDSKKIE